MVDLKLTVWRHRRAFAVTAAAVLLVPVAAFSAVGQDAATAQLRLRQEFLEESFVTDVSPGDKVVRVDVSQDPQAAGAWLDTSATVLDGWTVVIAGMGVKGGSDRVKADAAAVARDPRPEGKPCPDIPQQPRSAGHATTPYLGCGPNERVHATAITGRSSGTTLAKAIDEVLASFLPGADLRPVKVHLTRGEATVDVAAGFKQALSDSGVYPGDVWQALLFTAHSNGALDSVTFTLDGDCLAFAYATGGDMCVPTDLPIELG